MPTLFILLHVTFIINETFLSNCQNVSAKVLFRLVEEKKQKADNNVTVFQELLKQIGSTKPPPTEAQKNQAFKILGKRYNPDYQSVKKPPDFKDSKQITEEDLERNMDKSLKSQQFKIPGLSTRKLHKRAKKHFRLYLQQLSHCQLSYKWQDLGSLVWPRYIKETYCVSKGCSYPRGMTCQRSEKDMINVTLLYWTCHRRVRKSEVRRCGWSMVHINAVTQCICTCGDST